MFSRNYLHPTRVPLVWLLSGSCIVCIWQPFKYLGKKNPSAFLVRVLVFKMKKVSISSIIPAAGGVVLVPSPQLIFQLNYFVHIALNK